MSSLVHLGRAAATRAGLDAPRVPPIGPATSVADVMVRFPLTVSSTASLWTAWDELQKTDERHVVVVDDRRRPLGVLDDRTIAMEWPAGPVAARRTPVYRLLHGRAHPRLDSRTDLATAARIMLGARADAVPVVDRSGRLYGLITLWHFAEAIAGTDSGLRP